MPDLDRINIRPESSILSVLAHLNYKAWYALAEFVDNSVQSFLANRSEIEAAHGGPQRLRVTINVESAGSGRITIRDNAGGIALRDFPRAFKPAQLPADRSGLSEFGMGMKSAACWFARRWTVRTSAIGESVERRVGFDIASIVESKSEHVEVEEVPATPQAHFTEIVLEDLHNSLRTRTLGKSKDHLKSIYRRFTQSGLMVLKFDEEELCYEPPTILEEPEWGSDMEPVDGNVKRWHKEIALEFGEGAKVVGWAALLDKADTKRAGFALFRRNRLIVGSDEDSYRPSLIFGDPNSYTYQRLIGEFDFTGVDVSHTKDGFQWDDHEEEFLMLLRKELDEPPLPLIKQSRNFRARRRAVEIARVAERISEQTARTMETQVREEVSHQAQPAPPPPPSPPSLPLEDVEHSKTFAIKLDDGALWNVTIQLSNDPAQGDLLEVADRESGGANRCLTFRLALEHPFVKRHIGSNLERLEPLYQIAAALGLAEKTAMQSGKDLQAPRMRRNVGRILDRLAHSEGS